MSEQNQSFLRFSLEESIWFPKGFEVSELYSLSIEPDVNIIEKDQYVVIKGSLDISGEYRGTGTEQESDQFEAEQTHHQFVQDVFVREVDSMNVFNHRFPVDISIPANRIDDRNAIEVEISTFDYTMPESNCIKLMSELLISGIYDGDTTEKRSTEVYEESVAADAVLSSDYVSYYSEESIEATEITNASSEVNIPSYESFANREESSVKVAHNEEQAFESFTVEAYALPREESANQVEEDERPLSTESYSSAPSFSKSPLEPPFSIPMPVFKVPEMNYSGADEFIRKNMESQSSFNQSSIYNELDEESSVAEVPILSAKMREVGSEKKPISEYVCSEEESDEESSYRVDDTVRVDEAVLADDTVRVDETVLTDDTVRVDEAVLVDEAVEEEESVSIPKATATVSLTDFFGKKDSQTHTRLKVCIVQNGDSLSDIAGRYEVSRLDILSHNELNSENDVQEGQVLYIPQKVIRK